MKTVFYIMVVLFMGVNFTSCTPESITNDVVTPQACCDGESPIPPPPPPPPPGGGTGD